jgi:gliding motility-associated-like protein
MINLIPRLTLFAFLALFAGHLFAQAPDVSRPRPVFKSLRTPISTLPQGVRPPVARPPGAQPASAPTLNTLPPAPQPHRPTPLGAGTCIDTAGHILTAETSDELAPSWITPTRDGNILVPGSRFTIQAPIYNYPYLIKQTPSGSIVWAKSFNGNYPANYADSYKCWELNDGSLLLVGRLLIPEPYNGSYEMVLWHLDATGNLLWQQTDSSTLWQQYAGSMDAVDLTQDQAGNIYLAGDMHATGAIASHIFILKMDLAGNIQWDQDYGGDIPDCYGMFWTGSQLSVVGLDYNDLNYGYLWNMKLDPATGLMISQKAWQTNYGASQLNMFFRVGTARLLSNGNISVTGIAFADILQTQTSNITHGVIAEFDTGFNFLQGTMVASNVQTNFYNTLFTQHPSGRISYTYMRYISPYDEDIFYGAIEQGQIVKERVLHQRNRADAWPSNFINVAPDEDIIVQEYTDKATNIEGGEFVRLHDSDTSSVCSGVDTAASWVLPYSMIPYPNPYWDVVAGNTFRHTTRNMLAPVNGTPVQQTACQAVASCNSIQLVVDQSQVCAGFPATFTVLRNPGCGIRPVWNFDTTNIQASNMPSDTTLQLTYRGQFQGTITASMTASCNNLSASQPLTVLPPGQTLSLGANSWLCPDSTLVLRPTTGFTSYLWQDGSVADTLVVTTPGAYSVTVTNTCGTQSADVVVQQAPPGNFSVGPDLGACLGTPVTLDAPNGYTNYSWTCASNDSSYNSQSVTVTPQATTVYTATARTSVGCAVKSTLAVTVKLPLPVQLGDDTSFCKGDSLLLDAGAGFTSYLWNTGATSQSIVAWQAGAYSVKTQSPNGCYSNDTLNVLQIYSLPVVKLDADTSLCEGDSRTLNAGPGYRSYSWQDGSNAATLQVDTTGIYWVQVVDPNGCSAGDTVAITQILPDPQGFLIPDTVICNGYPNKIAATGSFESYLWSNGETTNSITIRQGGNYTLTVTDSAGCSATETLAATTKQCLFGIYFPNAFTPNGNGANDVYRPVVLGNMASYHLQVFNRWGQLVFATADYSSGWDGTINGTMQPTGTCVWICHYQFDGEAAKMEKGTLLLIR